MERFPTKGREQETHSVLGNLYLARNIRDLDRGRDQVILELEQRNSHVRENMVRARLALTEAVAGHPFFVFLPGMQHAQESATTRQVIHISDSRDRRITVDVPANFDIERLRDETWASDVILLIRHNMLGRRRFSYTLELFLDEILKNPKGQLPSRILNPPLPTR